MSTDIVVLNGLTGEHLAVVSLTPEDTIRNLRVSAELSYRTRLRLCLHGHFLDNEDSTIESCGIDDVVEAFVTKRQPGIVSNCKGSATLHDDGSVSISASADQPVQGEVLGGVLSICCTDDSFAALKEGGSVVIWGEMTVDDHLKNQLAENVECLVSNFRSFVALKNDGSVVCIPAEYPGIMFYLSDGVQEVHRVGSFFVAFKSDLTFPWGPGACAFDVGLLGAQRPISIHYATCVAYSGNHGVSRIIALLWGGCVVDLTTDRWIYSSEKGRRRGWIYRRKYVFIRDVFHQLRSDVREVQTIDGNDLHDEAFAVLKVDCVVAWGDNIGQVKAIQQFLHILCDEGSVLVIREIGHRGHAVAAIYADGSVCAWGDVESGGDIGFLRDQLSCNVVDIQATYAAFAAHRCDGSVVTWGDWTCGGVCGTVWHHLESGVQAIYAASYAFAALKEDGSVIVWGNVVDKDSLIAKVAEGLKIDSSALIVIDGCQEDFQHLFD